MNLRKIFLVKPHPPAEILERRTPVPEKYKYNWEPMALKLLAYCIGREEDPPEVKLWHLMDPDEDRLFLEAVRQERPGIVAFSEIDILVNEVSRLAGEIKQISPDIFTVAGGKQSSLLRAGDPVPFLNVDFIVAGDGMSVFPELVRRLFAGEPVTGLTGVMSGAGIVPEGFIPAPRRAISSIHGPTLRQIPVENHSPEQYLSIHQKHPAIVTGEARTALLFSGSGCPYRCHFCQSPLDFGEESCRVMLRPVADLVEEVLWLISEWQVNSLFSLEPNLDLRHLWKLYEALEARGVNYLPVSGFIRASDILRAYQDGILKKLVRRGVRFLSVGLDIPVDKKEDLYGKGFSYDDMLKCLKVCEEVGIVLLATFPGNPALSADEFRKQLDFLITLAVGDVDIRLAIPLRNTTYYRQMERFLISHPARDRLFFDRQNYRYQAIQFPGLITPEECYSQVNNFYTRFPSSEEHSAYVNRMTEKHPALAPYFGRGPASLYDPVALLYDRVFQDIRVRFSEWRWLLRNLPAGVKDVLDVGCGNGALLAQLKAAGRIERGVGVDISGQMIALAAEKRAIAGELEFFHLSSHKLPFENHSFDVVISFLSFRYLKWDFMIEEMQRVLRPGGYLFVVDMVSAPLSLFRFPAFLLDKLALWLRVSGNNIYRRNLRELVNSPGWREMLSHHPVRPLGEYSRFFSSHFPGRKISTVNTGRRSRIIGFSSGPLPGYYFPETAVMDWGIGGLGFYKLFKEAYPERSALYFSDSGYKPYGKVSATKLRRRLSEIVRFLMNGGVKQLVVACNAMSTVLEDPAFRIPAGFRITGVIRPTLELLKENEAGSIGIIGGRRTVKSGVYGNPLGNKISTQVIGQPLSAFIEKGDTASAVFKQTLHRLLEPLKGVSTLVLACTHYPAEEKAIKERLPGTQLLDPAKITLDWIRKNWSLGAETETRESLFFTTGSAEAMELSGRKAFGVSVEKVTELDLKFCLRDI